MRLPSKSATFAILMVAAAISAFILPASWTSGVRRLFDALIVMQWPVSSAARATSRAVSDLTQEEIPSARARELRDENGRLIRALAQQQETIQNLTERLDAVTGLRDQLRGSDAAIIIAPIVGYDANPRRDTLQIALGEAARGRVRAGQWVAAGSPRRPGEPLSGRELLSVQWLIGRIAEVHTQLARVQLASDVGFRVEVRTARVDADGTVQLAREGCILDGLGKGKMLISQATEDYFRTGFHIVVVPIARELPIALSLGCIESSKPRLESPQHFDLTVVPWQGVRELTHVYVIAPEP